MSSEESNARLAEFNFQVGRHVYLSNDFTFPKLQRYMIKRELNGYKVEEGDETRSLIIDYLFEATSLGIFSELYQNLEFLNLSRIIGCHNIVPSIDPRGLNELTFLSINNCEDLECIMDASQSPQGESGNPMMLSKLARLYMQQLPELKQIWKAPAQHVSLQTLTALSVYECNNLTYIFSLSQTRSLVQLKSLEVSRCERLECIVKVKFDHNEGEISVEYENRILELSLLRNLSLGYLPELISFCSENYYSTWPALEKLDLRCCPNLTVNNTELEANLQYLGENLNTLDVEDCSHLRDTIPALLKHGLKNLEELNIVEIGVQVVFQVEAIIAEGQENKLFPCLESLQLEDLRELQVLLYHEGPTHNFSLQNLTDLTVRGCIKLRRLLSSTLARNLLQLEKLYIWKCWELEQIIDEDEDEDHLQPICFPKLTWIFVGHCPKLKYLFHISVAPSLQKLMKLEIFSNDELEEVFWDKDGAHVMDYDEIVMDELPYVSLKDLPNLTNFWPTGYQIPVPLARVCCCPKFRADSENSGAEVSS
ncbi:hypothetical protein KPL71_023270 [Citrus sinensis]|uniref:Uncharacterized protein n=1 Tax=Citrus sinensis TaxID=2711 RepID=A0ACB8II06_CITSI|nr:hypothetical protein KPL71_023270 [Citrus sinensis]